MLAKLKTFWRGVRQLSGDDAYERYLQHYAEHHQSDTDVPLSKAEFFKKWQDGLWRGVRRCC